MNRAVLNLVFHGSFQLVFSESSGPCVTNSHGRATVSLPSWLLGLRKSPSTTVSRAIVSHPVGHSPFPMGFGGRFTNGASHHPREVTGPLITPTTEDACAQEKRESWQCRDFRPEACSFSGRADHGRQQPPPSLAPLGFACMLLAC